MKILLVLILLPMASMGQEMKKIELPPPVTEGGKPLMEALAERHSSREFSGLPLDTRTLSGLLWAANGYNRLEEKKRTAPSSRNYQEIDIYLATAEGLFLWDAAKNMLEQLSEKDIRAVSGKQDFVKTAALNLIYVADFSRCKDGKTDYQVMASHTNTGFIAQNVYLFCASAGLNTVVRGYFDAEALAREMGLGGDQLIILTQTVGHPPDKQ